ncbi:beta-lactamase/transpeptidase-like protein [Chaetomium fimeti]|uniref:Beta-lactamase/transpeptidase-like protein n=1 Tax=Chaetomium fimeti TaxID=1854472 RepID=A0AAE0HNP3_9PEZI|nr:beta-lactamase/transpeptidase-like protein [Chaetomium fimeti]
MGLFSHLALLGAFATLGLGQDCPIFGPAYPQIVDPGSATAFIEAKTAIEDEISKGISSGQLDNGTVFAIQVFSRHSDEILHEHYYGPSIGPDTVFRLASISKLMSVYTTLAELGDGYWNDPITKHVPELARLKVQNPVYDVDWSEVTLGAIAGHMGGIPRDYALGDVSALIPEGTPGLPALNETEQIQCGNINVRPCTREETFAMISKSFPIAPSDHTPAYSNMAFQLLSYAVEGITGKKFSTLVDKNLIQALNLTRTFLSPPINDTNAVVLEAWDWDFGEEAPGGGYLSTAHDLTHLGRSILRSTLLPPPTTRRWLAPITHTARTTLSVGRPWEIARLALPISVSPPSNTTRVTDVYSKQGSIGQYQSLLALSPDHGVGYAMLIGGEGAAGTYGFLQGVLDRVWLGAAEQAGREEVGGRFAGEYKVAGGDNGEEGEAVVELRVVDDEPGLFVQRWVNDGVDLLEFLGGAGLGPQGARLGAWLYPMGLEGGGKVAFRAAFGAMGVPAGETCASWGSLDLAKYGGKSADLLIFELGEDGKAVAVEVPVLRKTFRRVGSDGEKCKVKKQY